jgi:hypothetical protein
LRPTIISGHHDDHQWRTRIFPVVGAPPDHLIVQRFSLDGAAKFIWPMLCSTDFDIYQLISEVYFCLSNIDKILWSEVDHCLLSFSVR